MSSRRQEYRALAEAVGERFTRARRRLPGPVEPLSRSLWETTAEDLEHIEKVREAREARRGSRAT